MFPRKHYLELSSCNYYVWHTISPILNEQQTYMYISITDDNSPAENTSNADMFQANNIIGKYEVIMLTIFWIFSNRELSK